MTHRFSPRPTDPMCDASLRDLIVIELAFDPLGAAVEDVGHACCFNDIKPD